MEEKINVPEVLSKDFMFELTDKELANWRSQFGSSNNAYPFRVRPGLFSLIPFRVIK